MKYVIDTSILIDYLRHGPVGESFFEAKKDTEQIFIPTIVIFELFSGKSTLNLDTVKTIETFIKFFPRIELNNEIARRAGELYRDIGKHIDAIDYIIAASALDLGGTVVTLNRRHFEQIPGLDLFDLP